VVFETHWSAARPVPARNVGGGPPAVEPEIFHRMALAAADLALGAGPWKLEGAALEGPCVLPQAGELAVQTVLSPGNELRVFSLVEAPGSLPPHWALHFRGKIVRFKEGDAPRVG
jgi:hypothetical protein